MTGIKNIENKGFTLIEAIVVMAVFMLVIGASLGIFLSIVWHQKVILSEQELLNQASYTIEHISKALRMARRDDTGDCLEPGYSYTLTNYNTELSAYTGIKFVNQSDVDDQGREACQEFFLAQDYSDLSMQVYVLKEIKRYSPSDLALPVAITSPKLKINALSFVINADKSKDSVTDQDLIQPRITVAMEMEVTKKNPEIIKNIQTTISQRNLNAR